MMCSERQFLLGEEHNMPNEYKQVEVSSHGFKGNTPFDMDLISGVSPEIATVFVEEENHSLNSLKNNSSQPLDSCPNGDHLNIVSNGNASEDDGIAMGDSIPSTCKQSSIDDIESNPNIWTPPEPEDWGDEVEMSVANNDDDDDEYYDGTKWTQPSSLDNLDDGFTVHNHFKEERQRAMMEAMNGQLKYLVIQLFETAGIPLVMEDSGESWLPIISSLAWEAAMYLKPDVSEGNSMDIGSYVKVKCIASGSPSQSEMIKGLVFKKNTAHKHMSTKIANPRLLLLMGALGQNAVGLSSFNSMDQEMDYLKFAAEIVKSCSPNVVLVEKTVSRDIQECLLKKGITLVFDMNLNRLKKISRCTGSPIIATSEVPLNPQLRQCDIFRVEKFAEEHNRNGEGGKTPNKTLMFLEGCPKPHGCTILLRGAPSDVLKRMKRLVHYTVFGAYHLILETSFFIDQRATLSNNANSKINGDAALDSPNLNGEFSYLFDDDGANPLASNEESTSSIYHLDGLDCNGEEELHNPERSSLSLEQVMASTSSLNGKIEEPIAPSHGSVSNGSDLSSSHGSKEKEVHSLLHASLSSETLDSDDCGFPDKKNEQTHKSTMDSKSILVLSSSLCRFKDIICEQSHLSRIKYYGNSDMSLGRFIQDILLNKKHSCSVCNEPPESHAFSYTHVNGKLTALVKRLSAEKRLPGEEEGKIWMWTRCLKCEDERSVLEPSRRVVMSNSAHGLSFGKFLELSFSTHSASKRFFRCGHSLQRDCLRFFGLGSLVGMFMYQPVDLFTACDPPPVLEFSTPRGDDWLKIVAKEHLQKVQLLFAEIGRALEKMKPEFIRRQQKKFPGSLKEFGEVEELWREEKLDLEDPLMRIMHNEEQNMLDLPFLEWELLLEHYAWDQRLHSLLLSSAREESESPESGAAELEAETTEEDQSNGVDASDSPVDPFASDDGLVNAVSYDQESQRGPRFLESSIWASSGMRKAYRENLTRGHSRRFDFLLGYSPLHLSPAVKLEREWVHLPVGPDGHVISVCEDEISSLIAYAVATWQNQVPSSAEAAPALRSEASFYLSSFNSLDPEVLRTSSFSSFSSEDSMASAPAEYSGESSPAENLHPEVNLSAAGPVDWSVFCVHAKQFLELRRRCCSSEAGYLNSLRRCKRWDAQGGKSKAFFAKTLDDRLIIKQIKKRELESFLKFAPDYFKHISHSLSTGNQTCLAKVLGIYRVKQMKNGKETKTDLMVMENLLYGREITRVYDLKGAIFARFVADASKASSVLLDQNFVHDMGFSPFYLGGKSKRHLQRAIWNDTSFLTSINVMDYSLLVGVDEQRREMVFGIIDYLRQYTWDKQLETWVKSSLVVPKNASPTVISPKDYKKRFRKFMSKHFLAVPGS